MISDDDMKQAAEQAATRTDIHHPDIVRAFAAAWASIDGRLEAFEREEVSEDGREAPDYTGHYEGYMVEAAELLDRAGRNLKKFDLWETFNHAMGMTWSPMSVTPDAPMPVLVYFGNLAFMAFDSDEPAEFPPYREERMEVGYWDGKFWCMSGTGHDMFEFKGMEGWPEGAFPTHWAPLLKPPAKEAADGSVS